MAKQWYYQMMGSELGPVSSAELQEKVKLGLIQADTLIRAGQDGKWAPADRWKGLLPTTDPDALPPAPPPTVKTETGAAPPEAPDAPAEPVTFALAGPGSPATTAAAPADDEDDDAYHLTGEKEHKPYRAHAEGDAYEFFEFVGFRSAITPALYSALVTFTHEKQLSITQITRRAIAQFIGKPELSDDKKPEPPPEEAKPEEAAPVAAAEPAHE